MAKENKEKKKGGGKIIFLLILIIIAAAVIFILSRGGAGMGGSGDDGIPAGGTLPEPPGTNASDTATAAETSGESTGSTVIVEVAGESIYISGSPCEDSEALREYLLAETGENTAVVLRDNHAVKSVYDDAKAVLEELELEYSGETVE